MAIIKIVCTGLGDDHTPLADLTYKIYNGTTNALINSKPSATDSADVSISGTTVTLDNVDVGSLGAGDFIKVSVLDKGTPILESDKSNSFEITTSALTPLDKPTALTFSAIHQQQQH